MPKVYPVQKHTSGIYDDLYSESAIFLLTMYRGAISLKIRKDVFMTSISN